MIKLVHHFQCVCAVPGIYYCPDLKEYDQFMDHIQGLPLVTKPVIFGLHDNADLIKERQESELLLNSVLKTQVNLPNNNHYVINYKCCFFKII